jgi:hypothetical protein
MSGEGHGDLEGFGRTDFRPRTVSHGAELSTLAAQSCFTDAVARGT